MCKGTSSARALTSWRSHPALFSLATLNSVLVIGPRNHEYAYRGWSSIGSAAV